jgi:spoIIIJ-associated protein
MGNWEIFINKLIGFLGFDDYKIDFDAEHRHARLFIHSDPGLVKENLPVLVESLNLLLQLLARKTGEQPIFLDINNYRNERENLIIELVRAAARKVVLTKKEIPLPAMNSYERRIAHLELAHHPDVFTESVGKGKSRYVVVKPIGEKTASELASQGEPV